MALKYVCDICRKEVDSYIKIGMGATMYCEKCWMDEKKWKKIHEEAMKNSKN